MEGAPSSMPPALRSKPNIIVILIDDMGFGDIGPFGSKLNRTPNLDRMAAEGMKLTSFYCAPVCSASRAQLMTGCHFKRVGIIGALPPVSPVGLNPSEKTIAGFLKGEGYATMMIGKWHLGDQPEFLPTRFGFDHYLGLPYSNDMGGKAVEPISKEQAVDDKKPPRPPLPLLKDEKVIEAPSDQDKLTRLYTDEAVSFITANSNRPFFLYLAHTAVHVPLHPGADFKGKSANGLYGDWVEETDWSVGRVLETLRTLDLDSNTLVIFTSDNGPWIVKGKDAGTASPLRGGKFVTLEGGMREPAIAWWPGKIAAGTVSDAMLSETDLLPTALHLAGGKTPSDLKIDGRDIWPVLSGETQQSPHEAIYYYAGDRLEAIRSGCWKLAIAPQSEMREIKEKIFASRESPRLYDLSQDLGETTDLAALHPDIVSRLQLLVTGMDSDLGVTGKGPGVRVPGHVEHPQPLLKRSEIEYD